MKKVLVILLASGLVLTSACGSAGTPSGPAASSAVSRSAGESSAPPAGSSAPAESAPSSGPESGGSEILQVTPDEDATRAEVEYIDRLNAVFPAILEKLPRISELTAEESDTAEILADLKAPFQELAELEAPEKYAEVQAKMRESAMAMTGLVDSIAEVSALDPESADEDTVSQLSRRLNELSLTVGDAFAEALELAGAGSQVSGGEESSGEAAESGGGTESQAE